MFNIQNRSFFFKKLFYEIGNNDQFLTKKAH